MSADLLNASLLPILLVAWPLAWGVLLLLRSSHHLEQPTSSNHLLPAHLSIERLSTFGALITALLALLVAWHVRDGALLIHPLGNWPPPFGIVLVADPLAALFLVLTAAVALPTLLFARGSWDRRGRIFHPLFHLQWAGLNGAFLTGDIFNLFVFFEVLLIVSYALLTHGLGAERLRAAFGYVVVNLTASALFLVGLALIYGAFGSLTLADLAMRADTLAVEQQGLAKAGAALLLVVFAVKAAAAPLYLWLPASYTAATPPVAALFALMTKVGLYAMMRVHWATLGSTDGTLTAALTDWLLPVALLTALFGVAGALATRRLTRLIAYLTVASAGIILSGIAIGSQTAVAAALFYLLSSTLTVALLFLLVAVVAAQRGAATDQIRPGPPLSDPLLLGVVMLLAAASAIGIPPLPGFIGKLYLLQASFASEARFWVWTTLLLTGAITLVALARASVTIFWHHVPEPAPVPAGSSPGYRPALLALTAAIVLQALYAEPLYRFLQRASAKAQDRAAYAEAILAPAAPYTPVVRPYDGSIPAGRSPQ